ncbi:TPA: ead/Ea22-like family protein [Klebsiella pneumoniae subsp. ozaenae]|nr:ead/Ea22-like family protein [Klebsiella pneumoniae subsp. ozaenae]
MREQKFLKLAKAYQQLAAENSFLMHRIEWPKQQCPTTGDVTDVEPADFIPATDRIVAGIKADGRVEGAHFVANRMLAAWDAGFIEDSAKNAADIARMILTSTEFMADAPEGDFDRSFADGILEDIAKQLREGGDK